MRKFFFILSVLLVLSVSSFFVFYAYYDLEVLKNSYPVYDEDLKSYVFKNQRPSSWVSLENISLKARSAIIVSEDWAFYDHDGVDFEQLQDAISESLKEKTFVRGASTISQQVVKNLFLSNEKTLIRKVKEILLTLKLEKLYSKDKILEVYLNIIELGENLYGIGPASLYYFHKTPKELNPREGAFLAMLLPSPVRYSVSYKKGELTEFAESEVNSILIKLRQAKIISEEERLKYKHTKFDFEKSKEELDLYLDEEPYYLLDE